MARLCERPGCSESGAAAYGMVPEDLLFWIAPLQDAPVDDHNVLCRHHADAMVVPKGWTLDDRREPIPRLFMPRRVDRDLGAERPSRRRTRPAPTEIGEQLQIDGTGEIDRPIVAGVGPTPDDAPTLDGLPESPVEADGRVSPWQPEFDDQDDLGGLLEVDSPLLARAFRGTGRHRT